MGEGLHEGMSDVDVNLIEVQNTLTEAEAETLSRFEHGMIVTMRRKDSGTIEGDWTFVGMNGRTAYLTKMDGDIPLAGTLDAEDFLALNAGHINIG